MRPGLKAPGHVDRVLVHPGVPPIPMTPAEVAAAKESALRELNPTTLWDEITGGLVGCEVVRGDIRPTPEHRHVGVQPADDVLRLQAATTHLIECDESDANGARLLGRFQLRQQFFAAADFNQRIDQRVFRVPVGRICGRPI
jgi:hypothetical protein